jgi:probable F420-dependent oxidoreductase
VSLVTFGMQLPVQAQSTLMAEEWEHSAGPDVLGSVARACDESGFGFVGVCDHIAIPRDLAPRMTTTWYDTIATLGWLAGITEQVRLLAHVYIVPYRHPLQTAKAFSTLDALSGGRAILGVGAGHVVAEFEMLGVPFSQRGRLTSDGVQAIRAAFADEWGSGNYGQRPRPVQPGGPPIWIGGSSPAAIRRAASLGDGWLPQGPPEGGMAAAIAEIRRVRDAAGRLDEPFAISGGLSLYVGKPGWDPGEACVAGPPELAAERARDLIDLGITHLQVRFRSRSSDELLAQIAAFGQDVVPLIET